MEVRECYGQQCAVRTEAERVDRPNDVRSDDIVLGEFPGDSELLVHAPSEESDRRYLIALPLEPRENWNPAGSTAVEVLERMPQGRWREVLGAGIA